MIGKKERSMEEEQVIIGLTNKATKDIGDILDFIRSRGFEIDIPNMQIEADDITRVGSVGEFLIGGEYHIHILMNNEHLCIK